jgi:hypothetical protein
MFCIKNTTVYNNSTVLFYRGRVMMMLTRLLVQKVTQYAAQDSLVTDNKHIILMLQFQKNRV